jgi:hypothetical protein
MAPRTITVLLYKYAELDDGAKERARNWYREGMDTSDFAEFVIEDFATVAKFCGWNVRTRPVKLMNGSTRLEPAVYWSGFCSQGDGACFEGSWRASDVDARGMRSHAPRDRELHQIAAAFAKLKRAAPNANASGSHRNARYSHEMTISFETEGFGSERARAAREEAFKDASRDLMRWLYRALEKEYEYQTSDAQVAEAIEANEYEFNEHGDRTVHQ